MPSRRIHTSNRSLQFVGLAVSTYPIPRTKDVDRYLRRVTAVTMSFMLADPSTNMHKCLLNKHTNLRQCLINSYQ